MQVAISRQETREIHTSDENSIPRKSMSNPFLHSLVQAIRPLIFSLWSRSLAFFSSSDFFFCSAIFFSCSSFSDGLCLEIMLLAVLQRKQDPPSPSRFLKPPNWHAVQQDWSSFPTCAFEVLATLSVASPVSMLKSSALCGFGLTDSISGLSVAWLQRSLYARSRPNTTFSYLPVCSLRIHRFKNWILSKSRTEAICVIHSKQFEWLKTAFWTIFETFENYLLNYIFSQGRDSALFELMWPFPFTTKRLFNAITKLKYTWAPWFVV